MKRSFACGVAVLLVAAAGCALPEDESATDPAQKQSPTVAATSVAPRESAFSRYNEAVNEYDIEHFTSMPQLLSRSDAVFVGTVTGGHWGTEYRESEPDSPEDVDIFRDLVFELRVDRRIRGNPVRSDSGFVDVVIDVYDPREIKLDPPVGEQAVFFLRRVGMPVPGLEEGPDPELLAQRIYRPVSSLGVLDEDRGRLTFPMGGGGDWTTTFLALPWDKAIARLEELAGP